MKPGWAGGTEHGWVRATGCDRLFGRSRALSYASWRCLDAVAGVAGASGASRAGAVLVGRRCSWEPAVAQSPRPRAGKCSLDSPLPLVYSYCQPETDSLYCLMAIKLPQTDRLGLRRSRPSGPLLLVKEYLSRVE